MNELALFAGAGGGLLGSHLLGWTPVCAVEKEPYCREVLLRRQRDGVLPLFPIWDDIRTFDGRPWRGAVDIVTAGFPCQPWSVAGKRRGPDDDRNLWPDTIRVIREVGPCLAFLENVPGLLRADYFGEILGDLAEAGLDARWEIVSAAECGAPHRRERFWIVAYADRERQPRRPQPDQQTGPGVELPRWPDAGRLRDAMADADGEGLKDAEGGGAAASKERNEAACLQGWWEVEPPVGRVVDGLANRVVQLKALGNGQVPAVVRAAWSLLT